MGDKKPVPEAVRKYFSDMGKKSGNALKVMSKEKYGDESEYFRRIAAKRKRFGRLPKDKASK